MADFRATAISGSLTRLVSGETYLIGGANIDITTGSDDRVTIVGTGGGGSSEWTRAAGDLYPSTGPTTTDILIGNTAAASANTILLSGGGAIFNEQGSGNVVFRVESIAKEHAFMVNSTLNQVLIHSGGAAASNDESKGYDVAFYVSGTVGSGGTTTRGATLFGGDTTISGSLIVANSGKDGGTISGSIHHTEDGLSYIVGSGLVSVASSSNGQIVISATGDGSSEWTRNGNNIYPNTPTATSVYIGDTDVGSPDIIFSPDGGAIFNQQGGAVDFRVETDSEENALLVKGASNQVLILSGGAAASGDSASGADVAFFVSGTIGSRGTSVRGASVFGGDVIHSGSVVILDPGGTDENLKLVRGPSGNNYITFEESSGVNVGQIYANSANLFIKGSSAGNDVIFRVGSSNVLRMDGNTERIGIGSDVSSPTHMLHISGTQSQSLRVDTGDRSNTILSQGHQVLILSGGSGASTDESAGSDVSFYVSGTVGARGSLSRGATLLGGDTVISGSLFVGNGVKPGGTISGSIHHTDGGQSYLVAGSNMTISSQSNGQVIFSSTGGSSEWGDGGGTNGPLYPNDNAGRMNVVVGGQSLGAADILLGFTGNAVFNDQGNASGDFRVQSQNLEGAVLVDAGADVILVGTNSTTIAGETVPVGTDVRTYISGSTNSMGTASKGTSLITGDLQVSGSAVVGGARQDSNIYGLEVSGSSRSGAGRSGRLEYIYGSFEYLLENAAPRFIPLGKSYELLDTVGNKGKYGDMMSFISPRHDGVVKEVRLALSGATTNSSNPGNSQIAFYTSTAFTANVASIAHLNTGLTFSPAPSGFARDITSTTNITNDDGQTWKFQWSSPPQIDSDKVFGLAVGFTTGPSPSGRYHVTYTVVMEYNEFTG